MRAATLLVWLLSCASPVPPSQPVELAAAPIDAAPLQAADAAVAVAPEPEPEPEVVDPRDPNAPEDVAAVPSTAMMSASGIGFRTLEAGPGTGESPSDQDAVSLKRRCWSASGVLVWGLESVKRVEMKDASAGLAEGLAMMRPGDKMRLWIPKDLAGQLEVKEMAVCDVELVSVMKRPAAPPDVASPPRNAKRTKKGVRYLVLKRGNGKVRAKKGDKVEVHYSGWTTDGKMFDSSLTRGRRATFRPEQVIKGWTDVLQRMRVGDKWRVWIPSKLAYDNKPGRPAGMLVFEIEVFSIEVMPPPPKTPRDVKRPPKRAKSTDSGVRYRFLSRGPASGKTPTAEDSVTVHYSGWTTDGKLFDSSITRGQAATFALSRVIPGWRDGLMVMREGDKARMWIPEDLAYKGKTAAPAGMLVFDVELIEVKTP